MKTLFRYPKRVAWLVLLLAVLLIIALSSISGWLQDWLWMRQVGYIGVFWRIFSVKFASAGVTLVIVFFYLWLNLRFAVRTLFRLRGNLVEGSMILYTKQGIGLSDRFSRVLTILVSAMMSLFFCCLGHLSQYRIKCCN